MTSDMRVKRDFWSVLLIAGLCQTSARRERGSRACAGLVNLDSCARCDRGPDQHINSRRKGQRPAGYQQGPAIEFPLCLRDGDRHALAG